MSFPSQIYNQFEALPLTDSRSIRPRTSNHVVPHIVPPGTRNHEVEKIHFVFPDTGKKVGALFGFAFIDESA